MREKIRRSNYEPPKLSKYRVWIAQVNQCYYDVEAANEIDAQRRAKNLWRADEEPQVIDVKKM